MITRLLLSLFLLQPLLMSTRALAETDALTITPSKDMEDRQDDLEGVFEQAKKTSRPVKLPAGTFRHSGLLMIDGIEVSGEGDQTVLIGTTSNQSAIVVKGSGSKLSNIKISFKGTSRSSYDEAALVLIGEADNFVVEKLSLEGGNQAGFFVRDSGPGQIKGNKIRNTLADSIHITKKSHDITVADNITHNSGDDGIAVVSYEKDRGLSYNIAILNNMVIDNKYARGISVIGGRNILIADNLIQCKAGYAGIMMASESSFKTYGVKYVKVERNTVKSCGGSRTGHGAIMISRDNADNEAIQILENKVIDAQADGILIEGEKNTNILIHGNKIVRPRQAAIFERGGPNGIISTKNSVHDTLDKQTTK